MSRLITCPYNPCHQIRSERIQYHLVKCAKSHPHADLVHCPFNATHLIPRSEELEHLKKCPEQRPFLAARLPYPPIHGPEVVARWRNEEGGAGGSPPRRFAVASNNIAQGEKGAAVADSLPPPKPSPYPSGRKLVDAVAGGCSNIASQGRNNNIVGGGNSSNNISTGPTSGVGRGRKKKERRALLRGSGGLEG